jgi:hypothetical protein
MFFWLSGLIASRRVFCIRDEPNDTIPCDLTWVQKRYGVGSPWRSIPTNPSDLPKLIAKLPNAFRVVIDIEETAKIPIIDRPITILVVYGPGFIEFEGISAEHLIVDGLATVASDSPNFTNSTNSPEEPSDRSTVPFFIKVCAYAILVACGMLVCGCCKPFAT